MTNRPIDHWLSGIGHFPLPACNRARVFGQCLCRCCLTAFTFERTQGCSRPPWGRLGLLTLPGTLGFAHRLFSGRLRHRPLFWRRQLHTGPARLGKPNGDGLFSRTRSVFAFADFFNLFADKFTSLRRRSFPFPLCLFRTLNSSFSWHNR